jgi:hypothetical protein
MTGSFSIVTGYQHFQSGTLMPVGEKGSIPLLSFSSVGRFGHRRDRPLFGFIAGKQPVVTEYNVP